jgi:hypothetical protein
LVLRDLGMETAILLVDTQNPVDAMALYTSQGYTVTKEFYDMVRPME